MPFKTKLIDSNFIIQNYKELVNGYKTNPIAKLDQESHKNILESVFDTKILKDSVEIRMIYQNLSNLGEKVILHQMKIFDRLFRR